MYDYLIVGAGLYGAVFAQLMTGQGKRCLVIDRRKHIGGNIYTSVKDGIVIHQYGAHIFHTSNDEVWKYINRFARFKHYINSPLAYSQGKIYNLPFNMNTFNRLWGVITPDEAREKIAEQCAEYRFERPSNLEEQALQLCGKDIYHLFIKEYTEKQWGRKAHLLPASIIKRIPLRLTYDNNYFDDVYQGIPIGGYYGLVQNLLEGIPVYTEVDYLKNRGEWDSKARRVLFTGCIDEYYNHCFGQLSYRSLRFENEHLDKANFQGNAVVNYNDADVPFTRIIEHKHFEFGRQSTTWITKEYPQAYDKGMEPFYPIRDAENLKRLEKYNELAASTPRVLFGGRLGLYAYMDMDDTIEAAMMMVKQELNSKGV